MITPNEIENKQFKRVTRGYAPDEVDDFLDQLTIDYEKLYRSCREQTDRIHNLTKAVEYYQSMESTLNNALVLAEKTADERKASAEEKAAQIEKEAMERGEAILRDAKGRIFGLRQDIARLQAQYEKMRARVRLLLEAELELLERFEIDDERESEQEHAEN